MLQTERNKVTLEKEIFYTFTCEISTYIECDNLCFWDTKKPLQKKNSKAKRNIQITSRKAEKKENTKQKHRQ